MGKRVIGYIRVSSAEQAESGVSLAAQRVKLEAYAVAMDLELVAIIEDAGVSAKDLDRPGVQSALAALESGKADGLLITKLDRLTRSVKDLGHLVETYFAKRFSLLSVADSIDTTTASGRMVLNVLMSVAQWEREATAERTKDALAQVKREGGRIGGLPIGTSRAAFRDEDGRLAVVVDADETATLARMRELSASGHKLQAIADTLTAEGRATKRGGKWAPETVRKALLRAA